MNNHITVVGEALIDLIESPDGNFEAKPGGAPANVSLALARLDCEVSFLGRLSTDHFGETIRNWLATEGVDLSLCHSTEDPTSLAVVSRNPSNKPRFSFYINGTADWGWKPGDFDFLVSNPPMAFVMGSVAAAIEPGASEIEKTAAALYSLNSTTVFFDLNIRPGLGFSRESEVSRVENQVANAHFVKASDEDLEWLYPDRSAIDTAQLWSTAGHHVVITRGSEGAELLTPHGSSAKSGAPKISLVDSVGAGDAFLGAMIYGLLIKKALGIDPGKRLEALSPEEWEGLLGYSTKAGAITCTRVGCNPPTRAELGL